MDTLDCLKRLMRHIFFVDYFLNYTSQDSKSTLSKLDFAEEGRQDIYHWRRSREERFRGVGKHIHLIQLYGFSAHLLKNFVEHFNFMVILQMALAAFVTFVCKKSNIQYDIHVSLFITPIVFPLAFSINADFRRKEQVLEDLAKFKSAAMTWFFCMRDWREACSHDINYLNGVRNKVKGLMFHIREYLLTQRLDHRKFIVRVIYEDLSDANQLNEKVRSSSMQANSTLVSRIINFLNMMCLSFERLRVIREYRSPRSIRSFTKVLIFLLPLLLSPYYVHLGSRIEKEQKGGRTNTHRWSPYYISVTVAFVFGALQAVHDRLDDPFDGMCEDDINLDTLDEWTMQSLEATCHRSYKIGRFQVVSSTLDSGYKASLAGRRASLQESRTSPSYVHSDECGGGRKTSCEEITRRSSLQDNRTAWCMARKRSREEIMGDLEQSHPFLNDVRGNATIMRSGHLKRVQKSFGDLSMIDEHSLSQSVYSLDLQSAEDEEEEDVDEEGEEEEKGDEEGEEVHEEENGTGKGIMASHGNGEMRLRSVSCLENMERGNLVTRRSVPSSLSQMEERSADMERSSVVTSSVTDIEVEESMSSFTTRWKCTDKDTPPVFGVESYLSSLYRLTHRQHLLKQLQQQKQQKQHLQLQQQQQEKQQQEQQQQLLIQQQQQQQTIRRGSISDIINHKKDNQLFDVDRGFQVRTRRIGVHQYSISQPNIHNSASSGEL